MNTMSARACLIRNHGHLTFLFPPLALFALGTALAWKDMKSMISPFPFSSKERKKGNVDVYDSDFWTQGVGFCFTQGTTSRLAHRSTKNRFPVVLVVFFLCIYIHPCWEERKNLTNMDEKFLFSPLPFSFYLLAYLVSFFPPPQWHPRQTSRKGIFSLIFPVHETKTKNKKNEKKEKKAETTSSDFGASSAVLEKFGGIGYRRRLG